MTAGGFMRVAAFVVVGAFMMGGRLPAAAVVDDNLLIRIYDTAGVQARDLSYALGTTHEILRRADLSADWVQCRARSTGPMPAVCDTPVTAGDMVIRLVDGSTQEPDVRQALGYSLFDANGVTGFATVFVDRVDRLARRAQYARAPLLGRAIAHEIGHLILRSNTHTEKGLMREVWTVEQVLRNRREDWTFTPGEGGDLRNALLATLGNARALSKGRRPRT